MKHSITSSIFLCLILLLLTPASATARDRDRKRPKDPIASSVLYPDPLPAKAEKSPRMTRCKAMSITRKNTGRINSRYREGIDVSHYQERIDWNTVAAAGEISYVYLKATEGEDYVDRTYEYNLREARRVGLSVGAYHFYRPKVDPEVQFQNIIRNVKAENQDLVPMIDIEDRGHVSHEKFIRDLRTLIRLVEEHYGRKPLLYSYQNFYNQHLIGHFPGYHWMMAKYAETPPNLKDDTPYIMWQYTSSGRMPGIKGKIDRSCIMGDFELHELSM